MSTVTGFTAARSQEIEDNTIVDGNVVGDNLILTKGDTTTIDAGNVRGLTGATGPTINNVVWKYDLTALPLATLQIASGETTQTLISGITIPTVTGRRYRYAFFGVVQFGAATDFGHIRVYHAEVFHTSLYHGYGTVAGGFHDANRIGRSWVATTTNYTGMQLIMTRTPGTTTTLTLDPNQGEIWMELHDVGTLA